MIARPQPATSRNNYGVGAGTLQLNQCAVFICSGNQKLHHGCAKIHKNSMAAVHIRESQTDLICSQGACRLVLSRMARVLLKRTLSFERFRGDLGMGRRLDFGLERF